MKTVGTLREIGAEVGDRVVGPGVEFRVIAADLRTFVSDKYWIVAKAATKIDGEAANSPADGQVDAEAPSDPVNNPAHYTGLKCGVEVIDITEGMGFCLGNVIKYVLRCDLKGNAVQDLMKARWYLDREITRREAGQ